MKKIILLLFAASCAERAATQAIIHVSPGTPFHILPNTSFSMRNLTLTPSVDFNMEGTAIELQSTVTNPIASVYAPAVYRFSTTTNPFSGTVRLAYDDADLVGLDESGLVLLIHNGTNWLPATIANSDATNNYVETTPLNNRMMNELVLRDLNATLPLQWGPITARREGVTLRVSWETFQEFEVSHFNVERSDDGIRWYSILSSVPARNQATTNIYTVTDTTYSAAVVFYRIRQTDIDGRHTYSAVAKAPTLQASGPVIIFPNPATTFFSIRALRSTDRIRQVQLFGANGTLLRSWQTVLQQYAIDDLPAGTYHLRVQTATNEVYSFILTKQ